VTKLKITVSVVAAALVGLATQVALAGDCCCHCGGNCGVRKVCRIVPDKRKIEKTAYACECADVCIAGKACRGCLHCEEKCGQRKDGDCCAHRPYALLRWFDWKPTCGKVKTVQKLTKYTVSKEVCGWKWVIEEVCDTCCVVSNCVAAKDGTQVEKPPASAAIADIPAPPVPISPAAYLLGVPRQ
jgi:hypothetical protein